MRQERRVVDRDIDSHHVEFVDRSRGEGLGRVHVRHETTLSKFTR